MEEIIRTSAPIAAAVAIFVFALPAFIAAVKQQGFAKGLGVFLGLGALAFVFEAAAVKTGLLYGTFQYSDSVGYRVLDTAPWLVAVAVPPIMLGAFWTADKITQSKWRVLVSGFITVLIYSTIAPGVTRMEIWQWETPGMFFGVPLQAFVAWFVLGLLSAATISRLWGDVNIRRSLSYSLFAMLWFWGGVNLGLEQYVPAAIGLTLGLVLIIFMWRERRKEKLESK